MTWQLSFHSLNSFQAVIPILIFMTDTLCILCYFKEYGECPSPPKKSQFVEAILLLRYLFYIYEQCNIVVYTL